MPRPVTNAWFIVIMLINLVPGTGCRTHTSPYHLQQATAAHSLTSLALPRHPATLAPILTKVGKRLLLQLPELDIQPRFEIAASLHSFIDTHPGQNNQLTFVVSHGLLMSLRSESELATVLSYQILGLTQPELPSAPFKALVQRDQWVMQLLQKARYNPHAVVALQERYLALNPAYNRSGLQGIYAHGEAPTIKRLRINQAYFNQLPPLSPRSDATGSPQ